MTAESFLHALAAGLAQAAQIDGKPPGRAVYFRGVIPVSGAPEVFVRFADEREGVRSAERDPAEGEGSG